MSNNIWFYDRYGTPQVIFSTEGTFCDKHGYNLGYEKDNIIYSYKGKHLGWLEGYVIRDLYGFVVGFSELSNDYPSPIFPIPQIPPIPAIPQIPHRKPTKQFSWSSFGLIQLFK